MEATKPKVVLLSDKSIFEMNKRSLVKNKRDFEIVTEGSVERVFYKDKVYTYVDIKDTGGRGHHLSKIFMADVDKWLEANAQSQIRYDNNYREQMFNVDAIERSLGNQLVMVDINDCYWRNHIIWEVYNIFNELFMQFGNTFYMFLTDCLVTEYDKLKEVQKYLNGKNYRMKSKPIEFLSVDRKEKKITWLDFQSSNIDEYGRDKKAPKEKYYIYSNAQVVQSQLQSGMDYFKNKDYR